uniref:Myosin_tail_1 domain-containing protein n=1 Tax=Globodera pallida TaxID=36090 RepID=A0A183BLK1_GLOPA
MDDILPSMMVDAIRGTCYRPATAMREKRGKSCAVGQPRTHPLEPGFWLSLGEGSLIKALNAEEVDRYLKGNSAERKQEEAEEVRKMAHKLSGMEEDHRRTPEEKPQEYFIDDEFSDYESSMAGRARLGRTQEDLNKYKQRIDSNAENQKEYSEIIAAMQNKLLEYRRHIADLQLGANVPDTSLFPLGDSGFLGDTTTDWGGRYARDANYNYDTILTRLDEERQRYEELRSQLDSERTHSDRLQGDLIHLQRQFEQEVQEKEHHDEQKKVLDLWTELQRVRKQFSDLKEQTERELLEQRQEFNKIVRSLRSLVDGSEGTGGTAVNTDNMLIEIIRQIKDRGSGDAGSKLVPDLDLLNKLRGSGGEATFGPELYNELVKKYEEAIERNIALEAGGDENARRVSELEADLRKTREKLAECQKAIRKMHELSSRGHGDETRSRSLSPGNAPLVSPPEAVRGVRNALRNRDNEIQQLEHRLRGNGRQIEELGTKLSQNEEARRRLEKELNGAKRENSEMELEKVISEGKRKAREEADDYAASMELDYKNRIDEMNRRIATLQDEKQRLKNELTPLRAAVKDLENEIKALKRQLEEKVLQHQSNDEQKKRLTYEVGNFRERLEALNAELEKSRNVNDQMTKTMNALEQSVHDMKHQRDEQSKQREEVQNKLNGAIDGLRAEQADKESLRKNGDALSTETERLKGELNELERQLIIARKHADELDAQLKINQARQATLENELSASRKETESINELNQQLQRERQDAQNANQELENQLAQLQEQMRKNEQKLETVRNEISDLKASEAKAGDEANKQQNRADHLDNMLKEAETRIKQMEEKMELLENEYKDKLKKTMWKGGKSTATTSTDGGGGTTTITSDGEEGRGAGAPEQEMYDSELVERKIREINGKWKLEVEKLENEKEALERNIRELEEKLAQMDRGDQRTKDELEDTKRRLQGEIDRLKGEVSNLHDKHQTVLEEERNEHKKNLTAFNREKEELEDKQRQAERRLADALNAQSEFERNERELRERLDALSVQNQKLKDEMEDTKMESEKEIQKWKTDAYSMRSELKALETTITNLKNQLNSANDRNDVLNKTINDHVSKIRELTANTRKLEEDLSEARANNSIKEVEVENLQNRLRQLEDQNQQMTTENGHLKNELERKLAESESVSTARKDLAENVEKLKKRLEEYEESFKEQRRAVAFLKSDNIRLQSALKDTNKQADEWEKMANQFEDKLEKLRTELQTTIDKLIAAESDRANLRTKISSLQKELDFGREQMLRRNEEYDAAIESMSNAHRAAEDGRLASLQELESKKYEVANLESRLENVEQRMQQLQQDYIRVDNQRELLSDILKRFQTAIGRAMADRDRFSAEWNGKDSSQLESLLKDLTNRIEILQRERNQFHEELNRLRQNSSDTKNTFTKRETHLKSIEETLESAEDEKRSLEARLATAKQLLRSQEETLKQREEERRQLKAGLMTTELETRGKEAQLRHLNEQLKNLRSDLETAREELRATRDRTELQEGDRYQLEGRMRDQDQELQKIRMQFVNSQTDNQNLNEKVHEMKGQLKLSDEKSSDLRDDVIRLKRDLKKAEDVESELRRSLDTQIKENTELQTLKDQVLRMQSDLQDSQARKNVLEIEISNARVELREFKQRAQSLNSRVLELQRQVQDTTDAKNRNEDRLHDLEKQMSGNRITENEQKQQLEVLKTEKKQLKNELAEVREKLQQMKTERETVGRAEEQCKRDRAALLRKIEMYETEKRKTEAAIRETALQREAIEKSLNAMERENRELYKNCAQLQQQVAQLEVENGHRLVEITNRQREEQEKHIQRIRAEKAQIEKMMENREKLCKQKIRQLEQQVQLLREQLEAERRRSREFRDRQVASDAGRAFGMSRMMGTSPSGVGYSSLENYWPIRNDNIDSVGFRPFRSTYASNPLTPPRDASTPLATTGTAQRQETEKAMAQSEVPLSTLLLSRAHGFDQGSSSAYPPFPGREPPTADEERENAEMARLKYSPSGL